MREILFRAKAIHRDIGEHRSTYKNRDWVYGLLTKKTNEKYGFAAEMFDGYVSGIDVDHRTLGQYTGLKDINGKQIFEDDVCEWFVSSNEGIDKQYRGVIKYEDGSFFAEDFANRDMFCLALLKDPESNIKVLGNIHDDLEYSTELLDADGYPYKELAYRGDVAKLPITEVALVIHATWIDVYKRDKCFLTSHPWECSHCSQRQKNCTDYCPDCGAKMEGTA